MQGDELFNLITDFFKLNFALCKMCRNPFEVYVIICNHLFLCLVAQCVPVEIVD